MDQQDASATASTDTSTSTASSDVLDSYDFSKPDGGIDLDASTASGDTDGDVGSGDADQTDKSGKQSSQEDEQDEDQSVTKDGDNPDLSKMTEAERNNFYAQRRIAAQRISKEADARFVGDLRAKALKEYVDEEPNEQEFEDMDPQIAEQLRALRRNDRARQAEAFIDKVQTTRENTRLSIMQAETSIPLFNPSDANYNEALHMTALSEWAHRFAEVRPDAQGEPQIIAVKEGAPTPLEYLQARAPQFEAILKAERAKAQKAAASNRARSEAPTSSGYGGDAKGDSIEALEKRIGDIPLA